MIFDNELSYWNWNSKYRYNNEHPLQTFIRTAVAVADVNHTHYGQEKTEADVAADNFVKLMVKFEPAEPTPNALSIRDASKQTSIDADYCYKDIHGKYFRPVGLKFTPGGRITANAGTQYGGATLLNCFINAPVKLAKVEYTMSHPVLDDLIVKYQSEDTSDNLMNIFLTILEQAETLKSEGGYGINFGFIRPRATPIEGVGIRHPGVVSYMEIWDKVSEIIVRGDGDGYVDRIPDFFENDGPEEEIVEKNQIRKGAMMAVLPVWHPDIEEFVRAKRTEGKLTKFNVSVLMDDAFLRAVDTDSLYNLEFKGKIYKTIRAVDLYELIMRSTYDYADPGVLYLDNLNRNNPLIYIAPASATNPCVAAGTLVATQDGLRKVEEIKVGDLIKTTLGFGPVKNIEVHRNYPVKKVTFSDGSSLRVTNGHIFHTRDKEESTKKWRKDLRLMDVSVGTIVRTEYDEVSIVSIEDDGLADVYDLYEENADDWNTQGIISRGCGEVPGSSFFDKLKTYEEYLQKWIDRFIESGEEISGVSTVCLLGSLNLTMYVNHDRTFDYEKYSRDVRTAARFLENINDIGNTPLPQYQRVLQDVRQYGMGVNGLGSALVMMGVKYGSPEAIAFTEEISRIKQNLAWETSAILAMERGPAPAYSPDFLETYWFQNCLLDEGVKDLIRQYGARNLKVTTNPPLGNSSVICNNISNGVEPLSFTDYDRTSIVAEWPEGLTLDNIKTHLHEIKKGREIVWQGVYQGRVYLYEPLNRGLCEIRKVYDYGWKWLLDNYPEEHKADYVVDSTTLSVDEHIEMQAAMQRYVDQSISKTIIVPFDYSYEDFKQTYKKAWKLGLNGCTTYRVGTLGAVISQTEADDAPTSSKLSLLEELGAVSEDPKDRTEEGVLISQVCLPETYLMDKMSVVKREGNKYYMTLSYLPNDEQKRHPIAFWILSNSFHKGEYVSMRRATKALYELMLSKGVSEKLVSIHEGKVGGDTHDTKLGKAISMCLRHNIDLTSIVAAMTDIEGDHIATTLTAVRKFLKAKIEDGTKTGKTCLSCGSTNVIYEAGCDRCLDCGSSGCN